MKLLHWESDCFAPYFKHLEKVIFERPVHKEDQQIIWSELILIVEEIKLGSVVKKKYNST